MTAREQRRVAESIAACWASWKSIHHAWSVHETETPGELRCAAWNATHGWVWWTVRIGSGGYPDEGVQLVCPSCDVDYYAR